MDNNENLQSGELGLEHSSCKKNINETPGMQQETVGLKRNIGFISAIAMIIGTMIGSGIFVSPGGLLQKTGSVWLSLLVWVSCGLLATLGGMAYIELGSVIPSSGAEYSYLLAAFGPLPAFLYSWLCTMVIRPSSIAILCVSLAKYSIEPFVDDLSQMAWPVKLVSGVSILIVSYINVVSIRYATLLMNYTTVAKLAAMAIIIGFGSYKMIFEKKTQYLRLTFEGSTRSFGNVATSFYNGLWAYEGWNQLNFIAEEIKNPHRNIALSILVGVPVVTAMYLLTIISYLTVISPDEMKSSPSVANLFGERVLGVMAFIMPVSIVISTFGTLNGSLFTTGRLAYAAGRKGHLPGFLSFVDRNRNTPSPALIFNAILTFVYAVVLDIESLIEIFSFTQWIFYGAAMASLIRLRKLMPNAPRPFKVPIVIPWIVLLISGFLVISPIADNPKFEYIYVIAFIFGGLILYIPFVAYELDFPGMGLLSQLTQKLLQVLPPDPACILIESEKVLD